MSPILRSGGRGNPIDDTDINILFDIVGALSPAILYSYCHRGSIDIVGHVMSFVISY